MATLSLGKDSVIEIDADGNFGAGAITVGAVESGSLTFERTAAEGTSTDSSGYREFAYGLMQGSGEVTCVYDLDADTGQQTVRSALTGATDYWIRVTPVSGGDAYSGKVVVTSFAGPQMGLDEVIKFSFSFQFTGTITIA